MTRYRYAMRQSVPGVTFDQCVFYALFAILPLGILQRAVPQLADVPLREILYAYLYVRLFVSYRPLASRNLVLLVFLSCAFIIGALTVLLYGPTLGYRGFARFVSCALIAPLAAEMLTHERHFRIGLWIWICVAFAACVTLVMQFAGVVIPWLLLEYAPIRGGLTRHLSLFGEPNIGGMAAALVLIATTELTRSWLLRCFMGACAFVFLALSLSKGGFVGVAIACCMLFFRARSGMRRVVFLITFIVGILAAVVGLTYFADPGSLRIEKYASVATRSLRGGAETATESVSLLDELRFRMFEKPLSAKELDRHESLPDWFAVVFGGTYGIAGSVAVSERGLVGIDNLPHNMFLELYLVGGIVFLLVFLVLLVRTGQAIHRYAATSHGLAAIVWPAYIVLCSYMVSYPAVYVPALGTWFWLTVGLSLNTRVLRQTEHSRGPHMQRGRSLGLHILHRPSVRATDRHPLETHSHVGRPGQR